MQLENRWQEGSPLVSGFLVLVRERTWCCSCAVNNPARREQATRDCDFNAVAERAYHSALQLVHVGQAKHLLKEHVDVDFDPETAAAADDRSQH